MNYITHLVADLERWFAEWERCRPWLEAALAKVDGQTHTIEDIRAMIISGQLTFWPGERCAAVTEIIEYPRKKVLNVFLAGGDLSDFPNMERPMIDFARQNGCSQIRHGGREGWVRVLQSHGYRKAFVAMVRDV